MIDQLVTVEKDAPDGTEWGEPPSNFRRISFEEWQKLRHHLYAPEYIEFRQFEFEERVVSVHLFWYSDKTGWGYNTQLGNIKFYRFGCVHEFVELTPDLAREEGVPHFGRCYHVYKCKKCGEILSQDSSD